MVQTYEEVAERLEAEVPEDFWEDEEAYENKMRELAASTDPHVRRWVAGCYWVTQDVKEQLMFHDSDPDVRSAALDNAELHPDYEEALEEQFSAVMRKHKNNPDAGYRELAASPIAAMRVAVMARTSGPPTDLVDKLLEDHVELVRAHAAANTKVSYEALDALFKRGDEQDVINRAIANRKLPGERLRTLFESMEDRYELVQMARNPNCPADLLHRIAEEPAENYELPVYQESAYEHIVANPNVKQETIDLMLSHPDEEVVAAVQEAVKRRKKYGHS